MKFFVFRSIRTRIMTGATLLSIALVGSVVSVWVNTEAHLYRQEKQHQAKFFSKVLSSALFSNYLAEKNWSQIRLNLDLLMKENKDFVYILVSDARMDNQIVGASQRDLQGQYIPDIVPLKVTNNAVNLLNQSSVVDTFVLQDILFSGMMRAKQGDRVMEVASDIQTITGKKIGTLRFGISFRPVDRVLAYAVNQALIMGGVGLGVGWLCAHVLAKRFSQPILELQMSATKIAAGDLQHRAQIDSVDEIGSLATSFNEMTAALQGSFSKLQRINESFERFVPNKFISAIAPDGIENIHVGVAVKRNMTILFCDIRGYTSMSEVMTPLETFAFLNDYLACMAKAIDEAGGFIDKYIGDAIMALFDDEATDGAVKAAILMQQALLKFNYERSQNNLPKIAVGIGIHRGEVVMGTVGYACRIDSTVVGDAVNIASRIEGLTKQYKCGILVTESVVNSLQYPELFALKLVDNAVKVKGKDEAIAIYELGTRD